MLFLRIVKYFLRKAEEVTCCPRQGLNNKIITMIDQLLQPIVVQVSIAVYSIPMLFVHVIAGEYRMFKLLAQRNSICGITFDIELQVAHLIQTYKEKNFPANFKNQRVRTER